MDAADTSRIEMVWPKEDLEEVDRCPYCNSGEREVAHQNVQDWSFYSAPGSWTFWICCQCSSLYLSPRPTERSVTRAYESYYTHGGEQRGSLTFRLKMLLRNECWSEWYGVDLRPRIHLPRELRWMLSPLKSRVAPPFELSELAKLPRGRLMDIGCGRGYLLGLAKNLGWQVVGLEIDRIAAQAAKARGLNVIVSSYTHLTTYNSEFDCIICSHVLEHVYDPKDMIKTLAKILKPGGTLLLSSPNATSQMRIHFGNDWRGLEAPRHLTIPSLRQLLVELRASGFTVRQYLVGGIATAAESARIRRRGNRVTAQDRSIERRLLTNVILSDGSQYDFAELVCTKGCHN